MLAAQRDDGSWGHADEATAAETAYAMHLLIKQRPELRGKVSAPLQRARTWLLSHSEVGAKAADASWIGKELYCPARVDRAWVYCALLASASAG